MIAKQTVKWLLLPLVVVLIILAFIGEAADKMYWWMWDLSLIHI